MKLRRIKNPHGWTSIPNAALEDPALSWRAVGLLAYLLSRPPGWDTDSVRLAAGESKEGRDAIRTALTQLEKARYLHRVKVRRPSGMTLDGRYVGGQITTEWFLSDHPVDHAREVVQLVDVLEPDADAGKSGVGPTGGDNSVENRRTTDTPETGKPTPENPASLTTKNNHEDEDSQADPPAVAALPVEKVGGPTAAGVPSALAALADEVRATPALAGTDAIAKASRLEPGVQMFALRAHLVADYGSPIDWHVVGDVVERAHENALPSRRGRLSTADVFQHAQTLWSPPAIKQSRLPAALTPSGLSAAEPPPAAGMDVTPPKVRASARVAV